MSEENKGLATGVSSGKCLKSVLHHQKENCCSAGIKVSVRIWRKIMHKQNFNQHQSGAQRNSFNVKCCIRIKATFVCSHRTIKGYGKKKKRSRNSAGVNSAAYLLLT